MANNKDIVEITNGELAKFIETLSEHDNPLRLFMLIAEDSYNNSNPRSMNYYDLMITTSPIPHSQDDFVLQAINVPANALFDKSRKLNYQLQLNHKSYEIKYGF